MNQENEPIQFDEIIDEPLITDDGLLNPVAVAKLEAAIDAIPPTYERLAGNEEWSTPRGLFRNWISGALAKWAIRQSPYSMPERLADVIGYVNACLKRDVSWNAGDYAELSLCRINKLLHDILMTFEPFLAWNVPKKGRQQMKFVTAYDGPRDPDTDFIGLEALLHNVCLDIRDEWRADKAFDDDFEKRHPNTEKESER